MARQTNVRAEVVFRIGSRLALAVDNDSRIDRSGLGFAEISFNTLHRPLRLHQMLLRLMQLSRRNDVRFICCSRLGKVRIIRTASDFEAEAGALGAVESFGAAERIGIIMDI
jgi:hypothetical protein